MLHKLRVLSLGIFESLALVLFIMLLTADPEVSIIHWLFMLFGCIASVIVSFLIYNSYEVMLSVVPSLVCIGAFMYDVLHIRCSKTLKKCYKILNHEGSYKKCYETSVKTYNEYLDEQEVLNEETKRRSARSSVLR